MNILILCTGNSARSILAESILNEIAGDRLHAYSAGSQPAGAVHPQALQLLEAHDHDIARLRSKCWDEFAGPDAPEMDVVITVCDAAAAETCPVWPGAPVRGHWGIADPAAAPAPDQPDAFAAAYDLLARRAAYFVKYPLETMDPGEITALLKRIAKLP